MAYVDTLRDMLLTISSEHEGTPLRKELMDPTSIHNIGAVDRILLGMCTQPAMRRDEYIVDELTNHLFQASKCC